MEITKYGVTLRRLTEDKIEMVRNWRNDPKISQYMEYKEYITPEMQKKWFKKIDNKNNLFYIIVFQNKEIGVINIKEIDYLAGCGEAGIYIYDDDSIKTDVSFRAIICLYDYFFEILKLNKIFAHIMNTNLVSIYFNKIIGYKKEPNQENITNQLYTLSYENYLKYKTKIINSFNI
jgi:RimJ/RimL family protein N-acetyltransferase